VPLQEVFLGEFQHSLDAKGRVILPAEFRPSLAEGAVIGAFPGGFWGVHQFHTDAEGNLYTADVHVGRPQTFRPKKGASPSQIIGTYMRGTN
jgi:hypothetical protein